MDKYGDPTWERHVATAKMFGLAALKTASNLFVPLNITAYAEEVSHYVDKVVSLSSDSISNSDEKADFAPLRKSVEQIMFTAEKLDEAKASLASRLDKALKKASESDAADVASSLKHDKKKHDDGKKKHGPHRRPGHGHDRERQREIRQIISEIRAINAKVTKFEQGFISEEGLAGRPWYKHLGVAPGRFLGYGATILPGVTESITLDEGKGLQKEIDRLADHLEKMAARLQVSRAH